MFLLLEKLLVESHSRRHKFCDAALHDILCELRVLQLVAYSYLVACPHESRKICLEGMMRESRHRDGPRSSAGTLCEDDTEHLAGSQGIVTICFIKITAPEKKHCFRIFRLEGKILLHHWSLGRFLLCHFTFFYIKANLLIFNLI